MYYIISILLVVLIIVIAVLAISLRSFHVDSFASKSEKAADISKWFSQISSPSYNKYRLRFGKSSNVVEYEDALSLFREGKLTSVSLEKRI